MIKNFKYALPWIKYNFIKSIWTCVYFFYCNLHCLRMYCAFHESLLGRDGNNGRSWWISLNKFNTAPSCRKTSNFALFTDINMGSNCYCSKLYYYAYNSLYTQYIFRTVIKILVQLRTSFVVKGKFIACYKSKP